MLFLKEIEKDCVFSYHTYRHERVQCSLVMSEPNPGSQKRKTKAKALNTPAQYWVAAPNTLGHSTIHPDDLTGNPPAFLPAQERDRIGHLLDRSDAIVRAHARERLQHGLRHFLGKLTGGDGTGSYGVHQDLLSSQIFC